MKRYIGCPVERRKQRTRMKVRGQGKHRLTVFRSGRYIYAQIIDDAQHHTIAAASSKEKAAASLASKSNCSAAEWVGRMIAERGTEKGIKDVVFDRGSYRFHGRVKALADSARTGGLQF